MSGRTVENVNPKDCDKSTPESILEFAQRLSGKTLAEVIDMSQFAENLRNRGDLGSMVERFYFKIEPNSSSKQDFPEAGVELKTTGVRRKSGGGYQAKERLVLTMINYMDLVSERWETSSLMEKCHLMLILFYLYESEISVVNRRFVPAPILFEFPKDDLIQIRNDWQFIREKVESGRAHELSEGDTTYLGACRKGSGGPKEALRHQPFSEILAKARAFSLKPSYVNMIIDGRAAEDGVLEVVENGGIEEATRVKFEPYLGKSVEEISDLLDFHKNGKYDKSFYRNLAMRIMGSTGKSVPELDKAGIEIKTVRVDQRWMPRESMSFPTFKYMDIVNQEWVDSDFFDVTEQRFLFVVFREGDDRILRLERLGYWNMPYLDREEARKVWLDTKRRIKKDARDLPKITENRVAHVRPHARNKNDTWPTPQGDNLVKKSFWLNAQYISRIVRSI
jgi:DNA mismatch repair protein MutH